MKRTCEVCKNEFETIASRADRKYCSLECYHKSPTKGKPPKKPRKKCVQCDQEIRINNKKFCSQKCYAEYWTGREKPNRRIVPEERNCAQCGDSFLVGGRENSKREKQYCSVKCVGTAQRKDINDAKHPIYSHAWKTLKSEIIKSRGEKCEICERTERLQLHHIVPRKRSGMHDKENLMLLCIQHHWAIDQITEAGYKSNENFNPTELIKLIKGT